MSAALEAEVAAARAEVDGAAAEVERTRALVERGLIARAKLDGDLTRLRVAEAALEARKQNLNKGRAGARSEEVAAQEAVIDGLRLSVETARASLADAGLRAPFGGIIARRPGGELRQCPGEGADRDPPEARTPESLLRCPGTGRVGAGPTPPPWAATAVLDGLPGEEFPAILEEFSTQADPATRTYRGRVAVSIPGEAAILPGMVGRVIVTRHHPGAGRDGRAPDRARLRGRRNAFRLGGRRGGPPGIQAHHQDRGR